MIAAPDATLSRRVAGSYLGLVVVSGIGASILALREHLDVLFVDDWRILDHYQSKALLPFLFTAENGHRLPATLALFAADYEWLGGRMRLLVWASIACMALAAGLLVRAFLRQDGLRSARSRSALGFACFALFWAASCNDLLRGIYHMNLQAVALVLLALGALAEVDPTCIGASRGVLGLALVAALGATLSQARGVAIWPALVVLAALRRLPARVVGGLAAAGAVVVGLFAATLPADPNVSLDEPLARTAQRPAALAGAALAFVGSAPARVAVGLGAGEAPPAAPDRAAWAAYTRSLARISVGFGAAGFTLLALVAARRWRRPAPGPSLDALGVGLMAFGVTGALLVAFARASTHPAVVVQPRFVTWSTLFWIGAVCTLVPGAPERSPGRLAALAVLALPVVSLGMLPALIEARAFHATTFSQASRLTLSLLLGLRNEALARDVSLEDPALVFRVASRLEAEGRWPFQPPRHPLRGIPLGELFSATGGCGGGVDRVQALTAIGAAAVSGWVARAPAGGPPRFLVLADEGGVLRGLADSASVPPHYAASLGRERVAWTGFVADYDPSRRYAAYAVREDGRSACRLGVP